MTLEEKLKKIDELKDLLNKYFGACRFTYNWAIDKEKESYDSR